MNGSRVIIMMRCKICGSPIIDYSRVNRLYCDASTGCDCQRLVFNNQQKWYARRQKDAL
jgi:hypothetical protein